MHKYQRIPYPRLTTAGRDALTDVTFEYIIANITSNRYEMWNGEKWIQVFSSSNLEDISYDVKVAQTLDLEYENSGSETITVADGVLPSVETYNINWTKFNSTEFGTAHSVVYLKGYIYMSTRQMPARIAKINENDLTDIEIFTFPGSNSTSLYSVADRLIYSDYTEKFYIAFGDPDANRSVRVVEVNPDDITDYSIVIEGTGTLDYAPGFPTGVTYGNKLYILLANTLIEYDLDTFIETNELVIPKTDSEQAHAINTDGEHIFITEVYSGAKIHRVNMSTLLIEESQTIPTEHMTDAFAIAGDYLFIGSESDLDGVLTKGVYMVNKNDFTDYSVIYVEDESSIWEVMYDDKYVWVLFASTPGIVLRINPLTLEVRKTTMATGFNNVNSIVTNGRTMFVSTFDTPTQMIKLPVPKLFEEVYYAGTNNNILLKISNTNSQINIGDTVLNGTAEYATDQSATYTKRSIPDVEYVDKNSANSAVFDKEIADYNEETYYNAETILSQIYTGPPALSSVEEYDDSFAKTSSTEFSYPHGAIHLRGYIYILTRQMPSRIAKIKADDFTDVTVVTFPGTTSASHYSYGDQLIYSEYKDKFYVAFSDPDYDNRDLKVAEIDPETLAYSVVIDETGNSVLPGFPKGAAIGQYLYVYTTYGTKQVRKYDLSDYSLNNSLAIPITSTETTGAITWDEDFIYSSEVYGDAKLRRLNISTFTFETPLTLPTTAMSSNLEIVGDYLWVTGLYSIDNVDNAIYKVAKDLSSYDTIYAQGATTDNWGMLYDGKYIWSIDKSSPSRLVRINPETLEADVKTMPSGYNRFNKLTTDGTGLYFTTYESPSNLVKMVIPSLFDEHLQLGTDNDVLMKIDNVNKKVEFIDTIVDTCYGELNQLSTSNNLSPGTFYKMLDYRTAYFKLPDVIYADNYEPLIVMATSKSTIGSDAFSPSHPGDIIKYQYDAPFDYGGTHPPVFSSDTTFTATLGSSELREITVSVGNGLREYTFSETSTGGLAFLTNADTYFSSLTYPDLFSTILTDTGGGDGTLKIVHNFSYNVDGSITGSKLVVVNTISNAGRSGFITYRKDVEYNLETNYDFHGIKIPTYNLSAVNTWSSGNNYSRGDAVIYSGSTYIIVQDITNSTIIPSTDKDHFMILFDGTSILTTVDYSTMTDFGGVSGTSQLQTSFANYRYTFSDNLGLTDSYENFSNVSIGDFSDTGGTLELPYVCLIAEEDIDNGNIRADNIILKNVKNILITGTSISNINIKTANTLFIDNPGELDLNYAYSSILYTPYIVNVEDFRNGSIYNPYQVTIKGYVEYTNIKEPYSMNLNVDMYNSFIQDSISLTMLGRFVGIYFGANTNYVSINGDQWNGFKTSYLHGEFQFNTIQDISFAVGVDLASGSPIVAYNAANKKWFLRSDGSLQLSYYDNTNTLLFGDVTD